MPVLFAMDREILGGCYIYGTDVEEGAVKL